MYKWRETHSGIEGEEMMAAQRAEYKKIKAELREARTGDRFQRQSGGLLRGGSSGKSTIRVHPSAEEGNHPGTCVMCRCLGGVAFGAAAPWRNRGMPETHKALWRNSPIFVTYFFNDSKQIHLL